LFKEVIKKMVATYQRTDEQLKELVKEGTELIDVLKLKSEYPISGHRAVSSAINGVEYSDKDTGNLVNYVGITLNSANAGDVIQTQIRGTITEPSWNWDITKSIYVGNNGLLTQNIPINGEALEVAIPIISTEILLIDRQIIVELEG
jgi:hypothetical protein